MKVNPKMFVIENKNIDKEFAKKVLSHELAHSITLQDSEFQNINKNKDISKSEFDKLENECKPKYFILDGCFADKSLLNQYYQMFWTGELKSEFDLIQTGLYDKKEFNEKMQIFGNKYQDNFVSNISIENPEEDFSEIFSVWVLMDDKSEISNFSPVVQNKINFVSNQSSLAQYKSDFNKSFDSAFTEFWFISFPPIAQKSWHYPADQCVWK